MNIKSRIPLFIILGLVIGSIALSLVGLFTYGMDNPDDAVMFAVLGGLGFLGVSLGVFAFYGLVKAIYKKQFRALISWAILIGVYFLLWFAFTLDENISDDSIGVIYIGLMIMGGNEVWKIWKSRKTKSNNQ